MFVALGEKCLALCHRTVHLVWHLIINIYYITNALFHVATFRTPFPRAGNFQPVWNSDLLRLEKTRVTFSHRICVKN